ncbi:MlaA family lipoprotein [Halopseudomonas salegens]|uniref:Phospholipid-binding lipoprotein MlaA n=1 Tax=Halopseudomonas salegens TaxID=1434072 RepID=A0A1H2FU67_9GAMM|nr:VacJ family lipoprotein [Halopseudomonas salegens]SDU10903.1 phospholipid-binding lipoprotein MlaA [Halopseudomonas salegens]
MNPLNSLTSALLGSVLSLALVAPVSAMEDDDYSADSRNPDPWEPMNRTIFRFNDTVDTYTLKPISKAYNSVLPDPVNDGVSNVFRNLGEPKNFFNHVLQGEMHGASVDLSRFLLNSTLGVVGVFDVASRMGLEHDRQDFGITLGIWGVDSGPYLVLPLMGPSTVRDTAARVETAANYEYGGHITHVRTRNLAYATDMVNSRAGILEQERMIRGDRYIFVRNAYLQNREFRINDGYVEDDF